LAFDHVAADKYVPPRALVTAHLGRGAALPCADANIRTENVTANGIEL
jgi:hypothetical protein